MTPRRVPLPAVLEAASLHLTSLGDVAVTAEVESAHGRRLGLIAGRSRVVVTLPPGRFPPVVEPGRSVVVTGILTVGESGTLLLRASDVAVVGLGSLASEHARIESLIATERLAERQRAMVAARLASILVLAPEGDGAGDLVSILGRDRPDIDVTFLAASTPSSIARALTRPSADLVVITRGGGPGATSVTDTETVVRAVATCPRPVLMAVGHSRDHPLAELVAWRAVETPTAAAELVLSMLTELQVLRQEEV
ncbi:MAG: hypothetical protein M0T79_09755 [Actinomycetota bacterium]|nr:hypothetical protein [Actinomycetota bacterium]